MIMRVTGRCCTCERLHKKGVKLMLLFFFLDFKIHTKFNINKKKKKKYSKKVYTFYLRGNKMVSGNIQK